MPVEPRDYALFAHCFARGYDIFAVKQIAKALCARGIAVLRFDFTGIGACESTTPGRRYWSATTWMGWVIAASRVPEARGVVTVGAPASALHVTNNFAADLAKVTYSGREPLFSASVEHDPSRLRHVHLSGSILTETTRTGSLINYSPEPYYCELMGGGTQRNAALARIREKLGQLDLATLVERALDAENELFNLGITFTVYSDKDAIDRILPFDVLPRILTAEEWRTVETGVTQRVRALNCFLWDIYHEQAVLRDGVIPRHLVLNNSNFRKEMQGFDPPCKTYIHINGTDIVRDRNGEFLVLEDNGRAPSGVSYVVENRHLMQRAFPDLMRGMRIRSVSNYGQMLVSKLAEVAPAGIDNPTVVLLSPGVYNSAYFEHIFLAREMGVPLVEGRDLVIEDDRVFMRTLAELEPVHVIYRRINDDFLDSEAFNKESMLGVPGLMRAAYKGNVTLANAVGTGVADDKAVYAYVPALIRYYLSEEPIIKNVETHICGTPDGLAFTLAHLSDLVVKPVGESGGYGIVVGPRSNAAELEMCRQQLKANPDNFVSQPMIDLSVCPTLSDGKVEPRHVDFRPYAVTGRDTWVLPGGLTRVALKRGSIIVNSSQGGGTKDTWVLEDQPV